MEQAKLPQVMPLIEIDDEAQILTTFVKATNRSVSTVNTKLRKSSVPRVVTEFCLSIPVALTYLKMRIDSNRSGYYSIGKFIARPAPWRTQIIFGREKCFWLKMWTRCREIGPLLPENWLSIITTENWFVSYHKRNWFVYYQDGQLSCFQDEIELPTNCVVCSVYWSDMFTKLFSTKHLVQDGCRIVSGVEVFGVEWRSLQNAVLYSFHLLGWAFVTVKINEDVKFFWFIWWFECCYLWRCCIFHNRLPKFGFGIEELPCYDISEVAEVMLADEDFEADLLSTPMSILKWRYFLAEVLISIPFTGNLIVGVEIFAGHCLDPCV